MYESYLFDNRNIYLDINVDLSYYDSDRRKGQLGSYTPTGDCGFTGTFYGNGHTIRFKHEEDKYNWQGLFGVIAKGGVVQDLKLEGKIHCKDSRLVGGICCENYGTIRNCWVSADISSDWKEPGSAYTAKVGGVAGENNGTIEYCCVTGNVTNNDADVGGIVGDNSGHTIRHCTFYGTRNSTHSQDNLYAGDSGKEENCYDGFNTGEWDNANGYDMYRNAIKYPYAINVTNSGPGTIQVSTWDGNGVTRWYPKGTVTLTKTSGTVARIDIKDADGNWVYSNGDINGQLTFTMPKKDVNITVYYLADWPTKGKGTASDPYLVSNAEDWNRLAYNITLGRTYSGNYVKLTSDISVSTPVGNSTTDSFQGIFDGDGHRLTFNRSGFTEKFIAPFRYVGGNCTIKNLKTAGNISSSNMYATGLIAGIKDGANVTVENCHSSMLLNCTGSGDMTNSGFVGRLENVRLTIRGCVFDGSFAGGSNTNTGFAAWIAPGSTVTTKDCLFAPANIGNNISTCATFARKDSRSAAPTITNCYYTQAYGTAQRTEAIAATTVPSNLGTPTADYGMVKAYGNGLYFDGKFYGSFASISLADNSDNEAAISGADGYLASVTLADRTLYCDGAWNTICLPFDLVLAGSALDGAVARPLTGASISGTTLNLTFGSAVSELVAGTPYIIKWTAAPKSTAISGTSGYSGEGYDKLVDGNSGTKWCSKASAPWECVFKTASPVSVTSYTLTTGNDTKDYPSRNPQKWTLEAKANEGDEWTEIDSRDATANSDDALPGTNTTESQVYAIADGKQGTYQYFRFKVGQTGGSIMQLAELKLQGYFVSPVFSGVAISTAKHDYDNGQSGDAQVRFLGTYRGTTFSDADPSILLMGGTSKLYYPLSGASIGAQRAYFKIGSDGTQARRITAFNVNFGDGETTGVVSLDNGQWIMDNKADAWYTLDGKPAVRGIYIIGGRKVVIK